MTAAVAPHNIMNLPPRAPPRTASLIDVVLDHVNVTCCAADVNNNNRSSRAASPVTVEFREERQSRSGQRTISHSQSAGNLSQLAIATQRDGRDSPGRQDRPESLILPHLRFNPLAASASCSSLQDFFELFLADDAPHSFQLFHEGNGDKNVQVTPWKTISSTDREDRMERTVAFHTKITPGSSSNPLTQSEHTNSSGNAIPLEVTVTQSLIRQPKAWTLQCEFSFDFQSPSSSSIKLGTGLGQYLMSNVIKGSTVNVSVTLRECDEIERTNPAMTRRGSGQTNSGYTSRGVDIGNENASIATLPPSSSCNDGLLSCLSHPLLMPPDGLCSSSKSRGRRKGKKAKKQQQRHMNAANEPSQVGASLLSAIRAKNASDSEDSADGPVTDAYLATTPLVSNRSGGLSRFDSIRNAKANAQEKATQKQPQGDVLSCSSRGSLKMKHVPSFELSRPPSTASMRRMIVEKGAANVTPSSRTSPVNAPSASLDAIPAAPTPASSKPQGLSMRIEMELGSLQSAPSTTSSLSSFSRTASISTIDDKVRRGLKKRVARSWISWAESWCMRLWEDGEAAQARREAPGAKGAPEPRTRVNVRPSVRKIGEPRVRKERSDPTPSESRRAASSPSVWKPLQVERKSNRNERWMSLEHDDGEECGVEVACTLSPAPGRLPLDPSSSKVLGGTTAKVKRRLLKSLSNST